MTEYIELPQMRIKVKDAFNMIELIKNMHEWFKENYYVDQDGTGEDNSQEIVYSHAIRSGGTFLDTWVWWRCVRYPRGTTEKTSYVRYRINVDLHFLGDPNEIDIMHKGKKAPVNKMEVEFFITPVLEIDYRNEWKKGGLMGLFHDVFRKKIYKKEMDDHVEVLYVDAYRFHTMIKQFFKLETMMPPETVSQPPKGLM